MSRTCKCTHAINMTDTMAIRKSPSFSVRRMSNTDITTYFLSEITTSTAN